MPTLCVLNLRFCALGLVKSFDEKLNKKLESLVVSWKEFIVSGHKIDRESLGHWR